MATTESGELITSRPGLAKVDFGIGGGKVAHSAHIAYFWETDQAFANAVRFLEAGLRGRDHCVIFGHEEANQAVCNILQDHGFNVQDLLAQQRLTILGGNPSGDIILEIIGSSFQQALARGAPLIRLLGNIGWGKPGWPNDHDLLAFEAKVTAAAKQFPCVVVCMYDVVGLPGIVVRHGAYGTHPLIERDGSLHENPYYVPADIFLKHLDMVASAISERRRAEAEVRSSEERFRSLFENSIDAVFIADPKGDIEAANPEACRLFGRTQEEICRIGRTGLIDPTDTRLQVLLEERDRTGRFKGEITFRRKDGSKFLGEVSSAFYRDKSGVTKASVIVRDVTERRRTEETLRLVTEGTAAVTGSDFFRSLVRHLAQALRARYALITECTDETKTQVRTLAFWTGQGFGEDATFLLRGTPCDKVISGEVACYPERLQFFFPEDKDLVDLKAESYMGVPLYSSSGEILGHLVVMDDKPMSATDRDVPILRIFAARAGVELERKRAAEALGRSEERLRMLLDINNAIITKLTRDELFHAICEAFGRVVQFDRVALCLYEPELDILRLVAFEGSFRSHYFNVGLALDPKDSHVGLAFLQQRPLLRRDLETERQFSAEDRAFTDGIRSMCALPLIVRGKSIGAINVASLKRFQYSEADAEFFQEVANQIAIAIDNMQSYEDLRGLSRELGVLLDINRAIGRHVDRDELFGALAGCLKTLVPTDHFGIELPIEGGKLQGHILSGITTDGEPTQPTVLPALGTACDWVMQNGEWFVAASRDEFRERFPVTFDVMSSKGMDSLCALPLVSGDRPRGALFFMAGGKGAYGHLRREFLEQVASAVAVALDDCLAHEEVRQLRDRLAAENVSLQEEIKTEYNFEEIVGQSAPLKRLLRKVEQVAPTDATVLIQGETGTGKEILARAIHNLSARKDHPLVKVNCGAIPTGLVESELFGHEKGAFTGALQRRVGRFELADGGTLFLDEVSELPPETQTKLLRVLQEGEFERVGSSKAIKVDVRLIAATNRDLKETLKAGTFRSDLFYRLNVFPLQAPTLRERKADIPLLVAFFLSRYAKRLGKQIHGVSKDTMDRLTKYPWPGNIRELQNVIERAVVVAEEPIVRIDESMLRIDTSSQAADLLTLEDMERAHIVRALMETNWVIHGTEGAASILGINPSTLRSRIQKLGIKKPGQSHSARSV